MPSKSVVTTSGKMHFACVFVYQDSVPSGCYSGVFLVFRSKTVVFTSPKMLSACVFSDSVPSRW